MDTHLQFMQGLTWDRIRSWIGECPPPERTSWTNPPRGKMSDEDEKTLKVDMPRLGHITDDMRDKVVGTGGMEAYMRISPYEHQSL